MNNRVSSGFGLGLLCALSACTTSLNRAPIIERLPTTVIEESPRAVAASHSPHDPSLPVPAGYYAVKKGDTLIGIALDTGNDWRELATWNHLDNPNRILVGQQLRVVALPGETGAVEIKAVATAPTQQVAALEVKPSADKDAAKKAAEPTVPKNETTPAVASAWSWPAAGNVIEPFSDSRNKGIDIGLKAGDAVNAALEGNVVYAGNALRGYGNLIILKHNSTYLSAYAHNRKLLVKEGDAVKRGQQIAEAGSTDAERVKLHFEIRKGGKPVDPTKFLPAR
jgi:lipoprotein NlpD